MTRHFKKQRRNTVGQTEGNEREGNDNGVE